MTQVQSVNTTLLTILYTYMQIAANEAPTA